MVRSADVSSSRTQHPLDECRRAHRDRRNLVFSISLAAARAFFAPVPRSAICRHHGRKGRVKLDQSNVPSKTAEAGHELSDLSAKNVALFGIILAVIIVAAVLVTAALFRHFYTVETTSQVAPSPLSYSREPTPGPKLTVNPGQDLQTMRAAEDAALNNYEWVDREKGIVRIPVDRAIEILAQKGLPARPQGSGKTIEEKPQGRKNKAAQGNQR